jgi:hypothetical protein
MGYLLGVPRKVQQDAVRRFVAQAFERRLTGVRFYDPIRIATAACEAAADNLAIFGVIVNEENSSFAHAAPLLVEVSGILFDQENEFPLP